jgi:hypothetical protein
LSGALEELAKESYVSLASFRRSGAEVAVPVWHEIQGGKLVVFSDGTSGKVKRIRANPRVRVAACNFRGTVTGAWREGAARIVSDPAEAERAYAAIGRKYGWQMTLVSVMSRLAGRIQRRVVIEIELR